MAKVQFGLSNIHYALREVSELGVVTYGVPHAVKGAVNLSLEDQGDKVEFYADNEKFWERYFANGKTATVEGAMIDEWMKENLLGYLKDATTGLFVETDMQGKDFALLFQVETDVTPIKYILYNCTASKPSTEYATTESTAEPQTSSLELSSKGETQLVEGVERHLYIAEAKVGDPIYADFFTTTHGVPTFEEVSA